MTVKEAEDILFKIKQDNESKAMIIHNNSSNIQIRWSNKDLKDMAEIQHRCANDNRAIDIVLAEINKLNNVIDKYRQEREYIKNNLEVDLQRKGVLAQAKGQISQILEYYKNNDKYFMKEDK